jgi:predicted AlkP superfamily pyrophosphatase or phosphodiesterase
VDRPVTTADVAPTYAALIKASIESDGTRLSEVADLTGEQLTKERPALVLTVVWDGGGWNSLDQWPDAWPELRALAEDGVSYTNATVGSSPSVTPSTHTTLGTGFFPATHGISGIPVKDENGEVADSFMKGESAQFLQIPAFAERWDEQNDNDAEVGMIGYEPWHLGMVGAGAERPGGDKDDAVWLDIETNEWITQPDHYRLPPSIVPDEGVEAALADELEELDAADGQADGAWRDHPILDEVDRLEETPAFITYHADALMDLVEEEGYGDDEVTDFLFTNFKQIDRVGHYFSMESDEVRDSIEVTDAELGRIVDFLDDEVGSGRYVVVVTADHGMQPDEEEIDGFGINPTELEEDLKEEFGDVVRGVWPTEVFFFPEALENNEVDVEEVARFIGDYRVEDNVTEETAGFGSFEPDDRLFEMAIPAELLEGGIGC